MTCHIFSRVDQGLAKAHFACHRLLVLFMVRFPLIYLSATQCHLYNVYVFLNSSIIIPAHKIDRSKMMLIIDDLLERWSSTLTLWGRY